MIIKFTAHRSSVKSTYVKNIKYREITKILKNSREKSNSVTREFDARCLAFLKKIVFKQLKKNFCLNLSNDNTISEVLACTPRQVKRVREYLSKLNIISVPSWAKQKKKGDYPIWFLSKVFIIFEKFSEKAVMSKPDRSNSIYKQQFWDIYDEAKNEVKAFFEEDFNYSETVLSDRVVDGRIYMATLWDVFSEILVSRGLTREMLKK